jgi:DNA mismatch repair protein MSH5
LIDYEKLQVAHEISAPLPVDIAHLLNVVYFPQLGYLLTLPSTAHDYFTQNAFLDDGCTLQFTTQENCYYKNDRMRGNGRIHATFTTPTNLKHFLFFDPRHGRTDR